MIKVALIESIAPKKVSSSEKEQKKSQQSTKFEDILTTSTANKKNSKKIELNDTTQTKQSKAKKKNESKSNNKNIANSTLLVVVQSPGKTAKINTTTRHGTSKSKENAAPNKTKEGKITINKDTNIVFSNLKSKPHKSSDDPIINKKEKYQPQLTQKTAKKRKSNNETSSSKASFEFNEVKTSKYAEIKSKPKTLNTKTSKLKETKTFKQSGNASHSKEKTEKEKILSKNQNIYSKHVVKITHEQQVQSLEISQDKLKFLSNQNKLAQKDHVYKKEQKKVEKTKVDNNLKKVSATKEENIKISEEKTFTEKRVSLKQTSKNSIEKNSISSENKKQNTHIAQNPEINEKLKFTHKTGQTRIITNKHLEDKKGSKSEEINTLFTPKTSSENAEHQETNTETHYKNNNQPTQNQTQKANLPETAKVNHNVTTSLNRPPENTKTPESTNAIISKDKEHRDYSTNKPISLNLDRKKEQLATPKHAHDQFQISQNIQQVKYDTTPNQTHQTNNVPYPMDKIIEQIDKVLQQKPPYTRNITLKLHPPHLGELNLKVSLERDKSIIATITVHDKETFKTLKNHIETLKNYLTSNGIKVNNIDVHNSFNENFMNQFGNSSNSNNGFGGFNQNNPQEQHSFQDYHFFSGGEKQIESGLIKRNSTKGLDISV